MKTGEHFLFQQAFPAALLLYVTSCLVVIYCCYADFAPGGGCPRFNPGEFTTADTPARGEADAALIVASDPKSNFSQPAREHLART